MVDGGERGTNDTVLVLILIFIIDKVAYLFILYQVLVALPGTVYFGVDKRYLVPGTWPGTVHR